MDDPAAAVTAAIAARRRTKVADERALSALHDAIRAAAEAGVKQSELVRLTGYTREHIRQLTLKP